MLLLVLLCHSGHSQRLIMAGAYPDPSVVKIRDTFWASATTSNWLPAFPLLYSKDLVNWRHRGYIFTKKPEWADYYFWAPEMSYDSGRVYVYYTAHKKNGGLCVAVATADRPEGPYTDLGPIVCQPDGSIDAFSIRDTSGRLFLVWKEDANAYRRPTPIWAAEMNEQRTALIGDRHELFRNDAPWERELVEGVSIMRHGNYYYAFYAAAGCCGSRCTYESGVARAPDLLGPWQKYRLNPVLTDTGNWLCRGHGTPIEKDGRFYFLYHGYDSATSAFTGREALLQEFVFTPDDWIRFIPTRTDSIHRMERLRDEFTDTRLSLSWQWSVFDTVNYREGKGKLEMFASPQKAGSFIAQKIVSSEYTANAIVFPQLSTAFGGIAAIGDQNNVFGLLARQNKLQIYKVENGNDTVVATFSIPKTSDKIYLQMRVRGPYRLSFLYSLDGKNFTLLNPRPLRGAFLPPWDSPPRAGLLVRGNPGQKAVFDRFEIVAGILNPPDIDRYYGLKIVMIVMAGIVVLTFALYVYFYWFKQHRHPPPPQP